MSGKRTCRSQWLLRRIGTRSDGSIFRKGDLARAESYLTPAWQLQQSGVIGDHLGQVYERQKKPAAALHMYKLALEANPRLEETPSRIRNLANVSLPANQMEAREELASMRTFRPSLTLLRQMRMPTSMSCSLLAGK